MSKKLPSLQDEGKSSSLVRTGNRFGLVSTQPFIYGLKASFIVGALLGPIWLFEHGYDITLHELPVTVFNCGVFAAAFGQFALFGALVSVCIFLILTRKSRCTNLKMLPLFLTTLPLAVLLTFAAGAFYNSHLPSRLSIYKPWTQPFIDEIFSTLIMYGVPGAVGSVVSLVTIIKMRQHKHSSLLLSQEPRTLIE